MRNTYVHQVPADCNMSTHAQNCAGNGQLFNGNIAPLVNTTVRGFAWYQGENNAGGDMGNVIQNTGCVVEIIVLV